MSSRVYYSHYNEEDKAKIVSLVVESGHTLELKNFGKPFWRDNIKHFPGRTYKAVTVKFRVFWNNAAFRARIQEAYDRYHRERIERENRQEQQVAPVAPPAPQVAPVAPPAPQVGPVDPPAPQVAPVLFPVPTPLPDLPEPISEPAPKRMKTGSIQEIFKGTLMNKREEKARIDMFMAFIKKNDHLTAYDFFTLLSQEDMTSVLNSVSDESLLKITVWMGTCDKNDTSPPLVQFFEELNTEDIRAISLGVTDQFFGEYVLKDVKLKDYTSTMSADTLTSIASNMTRKQLVEIAMSFVKE